MHQYRIVIWLDENTSEGYDVQRSKPLEEREINETVRQLVRDLLIEDRLQGAGTVTWEVKEIKDFKEGTFNY